MQNFIWSVILIPVDKLMLKCIRNVRNNVYLLKNSFKRLCPNDFGSKAGYEYCKISYWSNRDKIFFALSFWFQVV